VYTDQIRAGGKSNEGKSTDFISMLGNGFKDKSDNEVSLFRGSTSCYVEEEFKGLGPKKPVRSYCS
jgi:hypothetical protein